MGRNRGAALGVEQAVLPRVGGRAGVRGVLMTGTSLAAPLAVGATLNILHDLALWRAFRNQRPPEETR